MEFSNNEDEVMFENFQTYKMNTFTKLLIVSIGFGASAYSNFIFSSILVILENDYKINNNNIFTAITASSIYLGMIIGEIFLISKN